LVASYDLRLGNEADLFSKEKISKEKKITGEAYDVKAKFYYAS